MTHYIFDLDGTLLNTLMAHYKTIYLLCLTRKVKWVSIRDIAQCNLPDLRETIREINNRFLIDLSIKDYQKEFSKNYSSVLLHIKKKYLY
ncbi:HAD hydrolase-like protein [Lactobacillus kefiranofaciens]|uniref:HAD hydrolase-like protein n=1 Tax=Lactobacillus kefiranofaciens TaxID=267818 RepID=UPI003CC8348D